MSAQQTELKGKRVTVMGLGALGGGVGVARYLAEQGAQVTVTDGKDETGLADSVAALAGLPITFHLGGHDERDFTDTDMVVRNPGVPRTSPYLRAAREAGVPIEMEMSLFFRACPAPILGITGTKGKTTVSTLCAAMLRAWRPDTVLAGNMGVSALAALPSITPTTPVVIELSSWQLEALDEHSLGPHVAVLTNISEDHLDQYDGFADYAQTKRTIGHHLGTADAIVFNHDHAETRRIATETVARQVPFGLTDTGDDGAWLGGDRLIWRWHEDEHTWPRPDQLALAGDHGAANALAAVAAASIYGADEDAIDAGLTTFAGVANRIETVATVDGVTYINDTSATAPAATVANVAVLAERFAHVHIIAGGSDKQTDLGPLATAFAQHRARVTLLDGTATVRLRQLLDAADVAYNGPLRRMEEAVQIASAAAKPGDVVVLSPGCASFGLFRNEFDRGEQFRAAVQALAEQRAQVTQR
jgi:UDP-N-acetylmuramoylalanine--D-glutamate ligase